MGRPSKRSPEIEGLILRALEIGNTRTDAALGAGITRECLRLWARDLRFLGAVEKAEALARQRFVGQIALAASQGSWQAAAWNLERRDHENWGRRDKMDMTVDVKREAERIAVAQGLEVADVLAEADRVLAEGR